VLNNRELASTIWLTFGIAVALCRADLRRSLWSIVRSAVPWRLLLVWSLYSGAITFAVVGLHRIGLGYRDSTKDAVVWALIAGLSILFKFNEVGADPGLLRRTLFGAVKLTALVEFFVNLYVFPLWAELVLQPFVVLVATTALVAGMEEKTVPAKRLLDTVSICLGLAFLLVVARQLVLHYNEIDGRATALAFAQPVLLTVLIVALTYCVGLIAAYELVFMRIGWKQPSRRNRLRARTALLITLHLRLRRVHGFAGTLPRRLAARSSWREARRFVRDYAAGREVPMPLDA
jgi:hypothetical protein